VSYNQRAATAHGSRLGTINDFFFQSGKNKIDLARDKMENEVDNKKALAAIQRKVNTERMLHQNRMANMKIDYMKDLATTQLISSMVNNSLKSLGSYLTLGQMQSQSSNIKEFFSSGQNQNSDSLLNVYNSIYDTGNERLA
jgi:hypothetical protein